MKISLNSCVVKLTFVHHLSAWLEVHINEPAINKDVRQLRYKATTITGNNKIAWLLKAISFIDLTTLNSDDTNSNVKQLCEKVHWTSKLCLKNFTRIVLEIQISLKCYIIHSYI